jgi:hypothetical protein
VQVSNETVGTKADPSFDRAIALRRRADNDYEISIDPSWWVDNGPNGGYLAAVLARAVELEATRLGKNHRPASASIHYLRPPRVGLATVSARLIRSGRTTTVLHLDLKQEQAGTLVTSLFTLVAPTSNELDAGTPSIEPIASPIPPSHGQSIYRAASPAYLDHWEIQPVYGHLPFSSPMDTPAGPLDCAGWIRLREQRPIDAPLLAAMADAWAPVIFGVLERPVPVPTLSFNLLWRTHPLDTQWCFITLHTQAVSEGLVDESVEIRAEDGTLLLQGRQLAQLNSATEHSSWSFPADPKIFTKSNGPCA